MAHAWVDVLLRQHPMLLPGLQTMIDGSGMLVHGRTGGPVIILPDPDAGHTPPFSLT